jgi:nucleoside-diphosphate-sugar epimerase
MLVSITGATGFVGSHTLRVLVAAGHSVRALVRDPAKFERIRETHGLDEIDVVEGDMTDPLAVAQLVQGADAVIHTAATVAFEPGRIEQMLTNNVSGVETVISAALQAGARSVVYTSSVAAIFHGGYPPITIDDPIAEPDSHYGRAKAVAETLARRLQAQSEGRLSILYPPGIVGPDDPSLSEANRLLQILLRDWTPKTTSGLSLVDVRDVAEIIVKVVERGGADRYLFTGLQMSWDEIAGEIARLTARPMKRKLLPPRLLRGLGRVLDTLKTVAPVDWPLTHETMTYATRWPGLIPSPAAIALDHRYRSVDETIGDAARWLEHAGHIGTQARGALPPWKQ